MLKEIRAFINEEKVYAVLLILCLGMYSAFFIMDGGKERPASVALEKIKHAEESLKGPEAQKEHWLKLFREEPRLALMVNAAFLFFLLLFLAGIALNIAAIVEKRNKQLISRVYSNETFSWGVRDIAKMLIVFMVFTMGSGIVLGLFQRFVHNEHAENALIIFHTTITDIGALLLVIYFVAWKHKESIKTLGLNFSHAIKDVIIGIAGYCAVLPLFIGAIIVLIVIVHLLKYEPPPHPLVDIFMVEEKRNPALIVYSLILACVIGPIVEEVFFRGFCYAAIKKKWGVKAAMVITAGSFALIHESLFAFLPIFILGLILAYLVERRGTLIPSITLHIFHNTLFIGYFFLIKNVFLDRV